MTFTLETSAAAAEPLTAFGVGLDELARKTAGWPASYVVFSVDVINPQASAGLQPEQIQVRLVGGRPKGVGKHGLPAWARTKRERGDLEAVVSLAAYRAALAAAEGKS